MAGRFIVAFVASKSDLVALVGDRVRPVSAQQESDVGSDYVTFQQIDGNSVGDLGAAASGLTIDRYQVNIVAAGRGPTDYARARLIARLLAGTNGDERLNGYRGTLGGIVVRSCKLVDQRDVQNQPQSGESLGVREIQQDYMIAWEEGSAAVPVV